MLEPIDWKSYGVPNVAGCDEVGRGCLAGPVFAAAVILPPDFELSGVTDSKLIKPKQRSELAIKIKEKALAWSIGVSSVEEIDQINILRASLLAMKRSVMTLSVPAELLLIDGREIIKDLPLKQIPLIKGDLRCAPISCASIIAKVARDELMEKLDEEFPGYAMSIHKGYGTPKHRELIKKLGPSAIHRKSFGGVREYLESQL
jgi:ribonuclease HII